MGAVNFPLPPHPSMITFNSSDGKVITILPIPAGKQDLLARQQVKGTCKGGIAAAKPSLAIAMIIALITQPGT